MNSNQLLPEMSISLVTREHANIATRILIEREVWCQAKPLPGGDFIIVHATDKETEDAIDEACKAVMSEPTTRSEVAADTEPTDTQGELVRMLGHMIWLVEVEMKEDGGHIVANSKQLLAEIKAKGTELPAPTQHEFLCKACDQIWAGPEDGDCVGACPLCGSGDGQVRVDPSATTPPPHYLVEALRPLAKIADAFDENKLDDYRKEWVENRVTTISVGQMCIVHGRGGNDVLSIGHAITAREALAKYEAEGTDSLAPQPEYVVEALKALSDAIGGSSAQATFANAMAMRALDLYEAEQANTITLPQPAYLAEAMKPLLAIVSGQTNWGGTAEEVAIRHRMSKERISSQVFVDNAREALTKYEAEQKQIKQIPAVVVKVEGGIVLDVVRNEAAKNVNFWVHDYDIPKNQPSDYKKDDNGMEYLDVNF